MSPTNPTTSKTVTSPIATDVQLAEEIHAKDCLIILRRAEGPAATELFFSCAPVVQGKSAAEQTEAMYAAAAELLQTEGGNLNSVIEETIFMRDMDADIKSVRQARGQVVGDQHVLPAIQEIQQPPLDTNAHVELAFQAIIPSSRTIHKRNVHASAGEYENSSALLLSIGDEERLMAGGIYGDGVTAYEQTQSMFESCEKLLHEAGMEFKDVVRTWFYLREMERDYYPGLNKARREFFDSRGIDPVPASTGIYGGMANRKHDICMGFYAVKSDKPLMTSVMKTPTLNEAGEYGADFTRGMRMTEANKVALHISGTASIDEEGRTAHIDDIDAQMDRMILNIKTLLENQGADFSNIMYAYNYLKDPKDEQLLRDKFAAAGFEGFPSVFVHAEVCRPDLLCETEVFAVLPRSGNEASKMEVRGVARPVSA